MRRRDRTNSQLGPDRVGPLQDARASLTSSGPKYSSASCALWLLHRSSRFSTVVAPPAAYGTTWWNSRKPRSVQRPFVPTKAHCPPSRAQTSRLTAAGMWREPARGRACCPWSLSGGEFRPFQIRQKQRQCPIEDRGRVAARNRVPQEVLRPAQFLVRVARHRELNLVPIGRERADDGWTRRRRREHGVGRRRRVVLRQRPAQRGRPRRLRRRKLANGGGHRRLRAERRNHVLHVALALVARRVEKPR